MATVSIFRNFTVSQSGDLKTIRVGGQPVGSWDRFSERSFQDAKRVLSRLHCGDVVWVDETHHHAYPSGDSGPIHYGREVRSGAVGSRKESSLSYQRAKEKGRLIRPLLPA